jgi:AcrR family transcriptional regulator
VTQPAYTRLPVDERRRQLLARAVALFARHGYDELSMSRIARESGISKALLYHYFPGKKRLFEAALAQAADEHLMRLQSHHDQPPGQRLLATLTLWLEWIDANRDAYVALQRSAGIPEVREVIERVRGETTHRLLDELGDDATPTVRAAVNGWLWFMDGVCLAWVASDELDREAVSALLLGTLVGALGAAGLDPAVLGRLMG